jgi:hypothetical protein
VVEPLAACDHREFEQIARLCGNATVAEVAYRRADGPGIPFDDGDTESSGYRCRGVRKADDSGADDEDIGFREISR